LRRIIPILDVVILSAVVLVLVEDSELATLILRRFVPQRVEDLRVTQRIGVSRALVDDFQSVEQPQHDTKFVLANRRGGGERNLPVRALHMSKSQDLRLGA
jgi:hypothetical protein